MSDLHDLYREVVIREATAPTGFEQPLQATHHAHGHNRTCGDSIDLSLRIAGQQIEAVAFSGAACAICTASASLMARQAPGLGLADFDQLAQRLLQRLQGSTDAPLPGDLEALGGVRDFPSRINCAALPWTTACKALKGGG